MRERRTEAQYASAQGMSRPITSDFASLIIDDGGAFARIGAQSNPGSQMGRTSPLTRSNAGEASCVAPSPAATD